MKYNLALQKAIQSFTCQGKAARVLDIGTGTGLLAMMAVKGNAAEVTACEVRFIHVAKKKIKETF